MEENLQRDFKGVWIPKEIWLDIRLNALDKIILTEINSLDNGEEGCYASNKYLAEFCKCAESKISITISKLKKLDYIEQINFDGRKRFIKTKRQTFNFYKADFKNLKDINIYNNIDNNNTTTNKAKENDFKEVIDFYNNNIGLLTPYGLEVLESYLEDFSTEVIIYAMQKSVEANKRNMQYIKAILNNWNNKGIKTLIEAKEESNNFNKKDTRIDIEEEKRRKREEWENSD